MITLGQAIIDLGDPRVMAFVVSDGVDEDDWPENPIDEITRDRWDDYEVEEVARRGSHSIVYASPQAEAEHPGQRNVRIRIEFLHLMRQP